jgi:PAS domain S-box-containing protein
MDSKSAELYRQLVASVTDHAVFALDTTGHVLSWNRAAQRLTGYSAEEMRGSHVSRFYPADDVAAGKPERALEVAARVGRNEDEGWRVRKDGSRLWANVVISAIREEGGRVIGFATVARDFTQRRDAEAALRDSEERFRLLVDSVKDYAIFMLDVDGHIASWNQGAERIKGYTTEEILGQPFTRFYPPEVVAVGYPEYELHVAARDGRFEDEGWRLRKDGSRFWANVVITALHDTAGRLVGFAKVTRDLTARRDAEEQARQLAAEEAAHAEALRRSAELAQANELLKQQAAELEEQAVELEAQEVRSRELADRLQAANVELETALEAARRAQDAAERAAAAATEAYQELDQFAHVASHDLKAPLRGIANLAQWIQDDLEDQLPAQSAEHMQLLQGRVRRMEALIDGILAYSRAGRRLSPPEPVNTGSLLHEIVELLALPAGVTIQVDEGMPTLVAERVPLQQVFMNLLSNAVKYARAIRPDVRVHIGWRDTGEAFEFTVSDNGPGIAPEYHERIWGMFQTLAARDKVEGTGIGLSVVKKIVESRGGHVSLESAPDQGATFHFTWPKTSRGGGGL